MDGEKKVSDIRENNCSQMISLGLNVSIPQTCNHTPPHPSERNHNSRDFM